MEPRREKRYIESAYTDMTESVGRVCVCVCLWDYQCKRQRTDGGKVEETTYIVPFIPFRVIGSRIFAVADTDAVVSILPRDWLVSAGGRRWAVAGVTSFLFVPVVPALCI